MTGLVSAGILSEIVQPVLGASGGPGRRTADRFGSAVFNMSGYAAPKLETVRIGFIGLGNRGPAADERMGRRWQQETARKLL